MRRQDSSAIALDPCSASCGNRRPCRTKSDRSGPSHVRRHSCATHMDLWPCSGLPRFYPPRVYHYILTLSGPSGQFRAAQNRNAPGSPSKARPERQTTCREIHNYLASTIPEAASLRRTACAHSSSILKYRATASAPTSKGCASPG